MDIHWRALFSNKYSVAAALVVITLTGTGTIPPSPWGGFYKNDPTLHQRRGDDTVPSSVLFAILFVAPLITFYISEKLGTSSENAWEATKANYSDYLVGLLWSIFFNEVTKVIVSEPRPHFHETCKPDLARFEDAPESRFLYYSEVQYKGVNDPGNRLYKTTVDAMKSFPSGHAQLSAFSALYTILYLINKNVIAVWKYLATSFFVCFSVVSSYSRVTDCRHHWWDVLAGDCFGIVSALIMQATNERRKYSSD